MQVLRDRIEPVETAERSRRLRALAARGDAHAFLIELGMLEQGAIDLAQSDDYGTIERGFSVALLAAGQACLESAASRERSLARALVALERIAPSLPRRIEQRTPEGYLHYALDPLAYAESARGYRAEVTSARAARAIVIGVRSIGTSLSAIVAAAIGAHTRATIRPRGPSGARTIRAGTALERFVAMHARGGSDVLIVDEGPGVTGETFEVVARWVRALGVPLDRIRLFRSHAREPELASDARRAFLRSLRSYAPPPIDPRTDRVCGRAGCEPRAELSDGRWRAIARADAPTRGLFERRKILAEGAHGEPALLRWAGLGEPAERALRIGEALASAALTLPARLAGEGFAMSPWVDARPHRRGARDRALLTTISRYLALRARIARTGTPARRAPIVSMLVENALERGHAARHLLAATQLLIALPQREATVVDGRLAPWEWLRAESGWVKVDAIDHGDGVHLPGPIDLGWDLAGAWIEHALDAETIAELARRCAAHTREPWRALFDAARAYLAPYAAFSLGDAVLCARAARPEDRWRLAREIALYDRALHAALAQAHARSPEVTRTFGAHAA